MARFKCKKGTYQKVPKSGICVPKPTKKSPKPRKTRVKRVLPKYSDYDDEDMEDFDTSYEVFGEVGNVNAAYMHNNGMVWDNKKKYLGRFTDDGFIKA